MLRVLPDCETGNCATMLAPGGGTSPFRLRLLLPPRCIDELVVEILVCALDEIIEREDSEDILRLDEVAGVSTSRRLLAAAQLVHHWEQGSKLASRKKVEDLGDGSKTKSGIAEERGSSKRLPRALFIYIFVRVPTWQPTYV